ncbi:hypothetical protein Bbelb_274440 [Branchiostoma belcheri]|nr:hypothetical protein Bbelb_274440 [Branchiostoma belcheri]
MFEWSCYENFVPLAGEFVLSDLKTLSYNIMGLSKKFQGKRKSGGWLDSGEGAWVGDELSLSCACKLSTHGLREFDSQGDPSAYLYCLLTCVTSNKSHALLQGCFKAKG